MEVVERWIPFISALTLVIGYVVRGWFEQRQALIEKKREAYTKFLESFYKANFSLKQTESIPYGKALLAFIGAKMPEQTVEEASMEGQGRWATELALWRSLLMIYGSRAVFKLFAELVRTIPRDEDEGETFQKNFAHLLLAMRLDTAANWRERVALRIRRRAALKDALTISPLRLSKSCEGRVG
jgi:hypothetical protein